jgi:hypothetical protein
MKRFGFVFLGLCLISSPSWADYLVIRINLNANTEKAANVGGGEGTDQPAGGPATPGGAGSGSGSRPGRGGAGGYGGGGNSPPSPGAPGRPGMGGSGGSNPPTAPGRPGMGGSGSGQGNQGGQPPRPGMGGGSNQGGGASGVGGGDGPVMAGGGPGGGPQTGGGTKPKADTNAKWFIAVVEVESTTGDKIRHPSGTITTPSDSDIQDLALVQKISSKTVKQRFDEQKKKNEKAKPLELAAWILNNWNIPRDRPLYRFDARQEFENLLDGRLNGDLPSFSEGDQLKIKALLHTRDSINRELEDPKKEIDQVLKIGNQTNYMKGYKVKSRGPYTLIHSPRMDREADEKITRLIHAYAGIHYWFALHGKQLAIPRQRMIVVLAEDSNRFKELHALFDTLPLQVDGFYSPLDNVAVISPTRVDPLYEQFRTFKSDIERNMTGIEFKRVIASDPPKPRTGQTGPNPNRVAYAQALELAHRAAQEESEMVTLMQETIDQLLCASNLVSRNILLPRSIRRGLVDFFAPSRSNSDVDLPTLWSGIGSPHWVLLPVYRKLANVADKGSKITLDDNGNGTEIDVTKLSIRNILADRSFFDADKAGDKQALMEIRARAEAWALMYYLSEKHFDKLMVFMDELNKLPRDMELSPVVIEGAFARAFELTKSPADSTLDPAKLNSMESDWKSTMQSVNLETNNKR